MNAMSFHNRHGLDPVLDALTPRQVVSPLTAIRLVAALYSVDDTAVIAFRRDRRLVKARALVTWVLRTIPSTPMSYPKIGRALGDRHHTTIIDLHTMAIRLRLEDQTFARCCDAIAQYFKLTEGNHACHEHR